MLLKNILGIGFASLLIVGCGGHEEHLSSPIHSTPATIGLEMAPRQIQPGWKFKTDGPVYSSPVVADGIVFCGSNDGRLYALFAATGEKRWEFKTGGAVCSSPVVAEGTVYFGSLDGNIYQLDANSGEKYWWFRTNNEIATSPALREIGRAHV